MLKTPGVFQSGGSVSREQTLISFARATVCCDVAVVEGDLGLFDGRDGKTGDGSTAQVSLCVF